jgi:hypothetical protein
MSTITDTEAGRLIWKPVGPDTFEIIGAHVTHRVVRVPDGPFEAFPWRAWSRPTDAPLAHVLECVWRADRRSAFAWCAENMGHLPGIVHLIGEA